MKKNVSALALILCASLTLAAADIRRIPLDLFLIVDGSSLLSKAKDAATLWMSQHLIDELLQDGDHLTIWVAADVAHVVFSDSINRVRKESAKNILRSMLQPSASADFFGALRAASIRASTLQNTNRIVYTLLVSGQDASIFSTGNPDLAGLIRFSQVEDFSSWRVMTIGLGLTPLAQQAAANYMRGTHE